VVLSKWESILYGGLNGAILNSERPPSPGGVDKPGFRWPKEFVVLALVNGQLAFVGVVINVGLSVVQGERGGLRLVPDRSLVCM